MTLLLKTPPAANLLDLPNGTALWPNQGQWTYDDYLRLPDDGRRYEIIEGVLFVANAPNYDHQYTVGEIAYYLKSFTKERNLGVILSAPFEVHLSKTSRPVQPDVLFLNQEQQPVSGTQIFAGAPTLVVEVVSPTSLRLDREVKLGIYEQAAVAEYWIADPKTRSVEVYTLAAGEYALLGQFIKDEEIQSKVLEGLALTASLLFTK